VTSSDPTVFLIDDDASVLRAVERLLRAAGFHVSPFDSPAQFLEQCDTDIRGCIVLDVQMPHVNGLELQGELRAKEVTLPIIFLTGHGDIPMTVRALKQGALDFLTKPIQGEALIDAVRAAIASDAAQRLARAEVAEIRRRLATLTPREYEVFGHVLAGRLNKQTAADLGTVEKTIKVHRARVMDKMQARSVAELVHLAERAGIAASSHSD
jgi:FixJ family two-component response regulator